jgi:hypothetical protein
MTGIQHDQAFVLAMDRQTALAHGFRGGAGPSVIAATRAPPCTPRRSAGKGADGVYVSPGTG